MLVTSFCVLNKLNNCLSLNNYKHSFSVRDFSTLKILGIVIQKIIAIKVGDYSLS